MVEGSFMFFDAFGFFWFFRLHLFRLLVAALGCTGLSQRFSHCAHTPSRSIRLQPINSVITLLSRELIRMGRPSEVFSSSAGSIPSN